jgi:hypothetical protein
MAPPPSIIKLFNTHIIDFIDDISIILKDPTELLFLKKKIKQLILINSSKFIKLWHDTSLKYYIEIEQKNYNYFLNKSYIQVIRDKEYLDIIERYLIEVRDDSERNKEKIMDYIYNLTELSKIYYSSKTN